MSSVESTPGACSSDVDLSTTIVSEWLLRCRESPNATAFTWWDGTKTYNFTYSELSLRVVCLAAYLWRSRHSRYFKTERAPNSFCVGLCIDEGPAWIVSTLACVLIGLPIVPINPKDPWDRIQSICNDTKPFLLICRAQHVDDLVYADTCVKRIVELPDDHECWFESCDWYSDLEFPANSCGLPNKKGDIDISAAAVSKLFSSIESAFSSQELNPKLLTRMGLPQPVASDVSHIFFTIFLSISPPKK